jgi:hypothetical protein
MSDGESLGNIEYDLSDVGFLDASTENPKRGHGVYARTIYTLLNHMDHGRIRNARAESTPPPRQAGKSHSPGE